MASVRSGAVWQQIQRLFRLGSMAGLSDWELLRRYADRRDETAFEALVALHGPMVLATCVRMLDDPIDVEDDFQATFLVLVRRATSLGPGDAIGPWLYGVATRVALRSRSVTAKRRSRERRADSLEAQAPESGDPAEIRPVLDRELDRLPAGYRAAVVLCYLEGRTHEEAARRLGWPLGTLKGRLSRARGLLKERLTGRGMALSSGVLTTHLAGEARAAVPPAMFGMFHKAARVAASGESAAGVFSASSVALAEGAVQAMRFQRFKTVAAASTMLLAFTAGAGAYYWQDAVPTPVRGRSIPAKPAGPRRDPVLVAKAEPAPEPPGDEVSIEKLPPVVVRSTPASGADDVDPALGEIKVTFSKPMTDGSWSWSQLSDESFPKIQGKPKYDASKRTCSASVKLEPGKTYAIWLNSGRFRNFKDASGQPAVPYLLVFKTRG
jgi:RNA polymerase sigma factor (sigma-70 family)